MISKINKVIFFGLFTACSILLNACSTTHYIENWNDPDYKGPALSKILVIGVINKEENRRKFEDEFSELLTTQNRTGITSYSLIPDLKNNGNKETVLDVVEKVGADGVLIVTTHGLIQKDRVTAGSVDYIPNMGRNYGMYGYYNLSHSFVYTQGNTVTDSLLKIDTKLYNVSTEKMIWSAKTESFNPTSTEEIIAELENLVVSDMEASNMIK
ncbi:MAG: hypothetical protein DIZ80_00170 [endosymbiont of Galathealinum brachiosum]|uniref:DUF4136 domain-containing protein n=1 Tax=endosymbiont of Galathealinum brachiosum TaxID=2200906 RepID=A0A370DNQ1_9GAMM|nr:MAG: hypothetical protein DIZ80_00170 [endosymbiont of Galathealinum brachiosum]